MDVKLKELIFKELENSFKILSDGDKRWEEILKVSEKSVKTYNYLHDQLVHTLRFQLDSEIIESLPNLKESIISNVSEKISEEIELLDSTRCECKKILESLGTKEEKIISMFSTLEDPCEEVSTSLSVLHQGRTCLLASYLRMTTALFEAKSLEVAIPKASFAYHPSQRQTIQSCLAKWKFYSRN